MDHPTVSQDIGNDAVTQFPISFSPAGAFRASPGIAFVAPCSSRALFRNSNPYRPGLGAVSKPGSLGPTGGRAGRFALWYFL